MTNKLPVMIILIVFLLFIYVKITKKWNANIY